MKALTVALGLLFLAPPAYAVVCNSMPMSTYEYAKANNGPGLNKEMSCAKLPEEACVCFDGIEDWSVTTLVDLYENDLSKPIFSSECPEGQVGCDPVGYDQKYWGKKAVNDPSKLQAFKAAKAAAEADRLAKLQAVTSALEALKAGCSDTDVDFDSPSTLAATKVKLKEFKAAVRTCLLNAVKAIRQGQ